jgi:hypothetical protein
MRTFILMILCSLVFGFAVADPTGRRVSGTNPEPTQAIRPSPTPIPDLSGAWMDNGRAVTIVQSGSSVTATYDADYDCDPRDGGAVQKTKDDFSGATLSGNKLSGQITVCGYGKGNPYGTGLRKVSFTLTLKDRKTLEGQFANPNTGQDVPFVITRNCNDKSKLCAGLERAEKTLAAAKEKAGSAALYQNLQQDLGGQLNRLRNEICDDAADQQLADIQSSLDSLNYVAGQSNTPNNLALLKIQDGLNALSKTECGAASANDPACKGNEKKAGPGEEEAAKFIKSKFKDALDKVADTARQMQDRGATVPQQIKDQIKDLKKAVGFWDQIKAGSCVPFDVMQTMQQVMNDRKATGYSDNCPAMCSALRKWYESLIGEGKSIQGKYFMDDCLARCH